MAAHIKILIGDDHALIRTAFKTLLELEDGLEVIDCAITSGKDVLKCALNLKPDILLLDINMPEMSGLEVLKELRRQSYIQKVIMLSVHDTIDYVRSAFDAGSNGYLTKDVDTQTLLDAIKRVYSGKDYVQPELSAKLMKFQACTENSIVNVKPTATEPTYTIITDVEEELKVLTDREIEILTLLVRGVNTIQIGETLHIAEKTVRNHLHKMYKKMNVTDRTQAILYGLQHGLS